MKKTIPLLFILLFSTSCTTEELELSVDSKKITIENAVKIATNARKEFFSNEQRANTQSAVVDANAIYCYEGRGTRSQSTDSLFYVVNFEDNGGFAIVNCDAAGEPLLGVSDCGHFNPYEEQENENFRFFVEQLIDYTSSVNSVSITPIGPITPPYNPPGVCPAKIDLQWGQGYPYGCYSPNGVAGCTITAGAMLMAYFRQPQTLEITYGDNPETITLNWTEINKHKRTNTNCTETNSAVVHDMIGKLCRQLGYLCEADYSNESSTGASENKLRNTLISFGYTCSFYRTFDSVDYTNLLDNNHILLVRGDRTTNDPDAPTSAHLWIMDGYQRMYTIPDPQGNCSTTTYCHYNWGWSGKSNGYFLAGIFDTTNAHQYDNVNWGIQNKNYDVSIKLSAVTYSTH